MQKAIQLAPTPIYQAEKPVRNNLYWRFVKPFPCVVSDVTRNIDPCHTGSHERSQESPNMRCAPLCRKCHEQFGSGPKCLAFLHHLNIPALIHRFDAHPEPKTKENCMTATCTNCDSTFRDVDRNEDGSPYIETTRCSHPGCEVYLCRAGCEHLSFFCEGCRSRFCGEHKVTLDGLELCADCAMRLVEDQEPECECSPSDADLFDAAGCEYHNPNSPWNVRLRAVTAVQMDEQKRKGDRMSRNYQRHPELFPALAVVEYDPDVNGWKADARAELKGVEEAVADYCNLTVDLGDPCDCMQGGRPRSVEVRSRMTLGTWA
jgi:hypothetical protein